MADTPTRPKLAYRPGEAADEIGVSRRHIYRLLSEGKLLARKVGRATVIDHSELVRYLASCPQAEFGDL